MTKKGKIIPLNPRMESLSAEKLKTFPGCEHFSPEEAEQALIEIKLLSTILLGMLNAEEQENNNDENSIAA